MEATQDVELSHTPSLPQRPSELALRGGSQLSSILGIPGIGQLPEASNTELSLPPINVGEESLQSETQSRGMVRRSLYSGPLTARSGGAQVLVLSDGSQVMLHI